MWEDNLQIVIEWGQRQGSAVLLSQFFTIGQTKDNWQQLQLWKLELIKVFLSWYYFCMLSECNQFLFKLDSHYPSPSKQDYFNSKITFGQLAEWKYLC